MLNIHAAKKNLDFDVKLFETTKEWLMFFCMLKKLIYLHLKYILLLLFFHIHKCVHIYFSFSILENSLSYLQKLSSHKI